MDPDVVTAVDDVLCAEPSAAEAEEIRAFCLFDFDFDPFHGCTRAARVRDIVTVRFGGGGVGGSPYVLRASFERTSASPSARSTPRWRSSMTA